MAGGKTSGAMLVPAGTTDVNFLKVAWVATSLEELHQHGITHGDLHAGNILLGQEGKIWFTDFRPALQDSPTADIQQRIRADWDAFARMGV